MTHKGMLSSSRTQHRQQREKLLLDGCCQVWRFLITCSLNGMAASSGEKRAPLCCTPPTSSQREAWAVIDSWVQDFCCSPIEAFAIRPFSEITKSKDIDYSGDEVSHALPLKVGELLPGLPVSGIAGTLSAVEAADPQVRAWVQDPGLAMNPREEWPTTVPKARINSTKEEWYKLCGILFERGIIEPIAYGDIFKVDNVPVLNGAFAVEKKGKAAPGECRVAGKCARASMPLDLRCSHSSAHGLDKRSEPFSTFTSTGRHGPLAKRRWPSR